MRFFSPPASGYEVPPCLFQPCFEIIQYQVKDGNQKQCDHRGKKDAEGERDRHGNDYFRLQTGLQHNGNQPTLKPVELRDLL